MIIYQEQLLQISRFTTGKCISMIFGALVRNSTEKQPRSAAQRQSCMYYFSKRNNTISLPTTDANIDTKNRLPLFQMTENTVFAFRASNGWTAAPILTQQRHRNHCKAQTYRNDCPSYWEPGFHTWLRFTKLLPEACHPSTIDIWTPLWSLHPYWRFFRHNSRKMRLQMFTRTKGVST